MRSIEPFYVDIRKRPVRYIVGAIAMFALVAYFLIITNLLPTPLKASEQERIDTTSEGVRGSAITEPVAKEEPVRIVIPKAGVDSIINNPSDTNHTTLDHYLTKGAVRYPGSGYLGQGNMFIFGHSTNHQVVRNQAYKTFNNIEKLVPGDIIEVHGATHTYRYAVTSVKLVNADEAFVQFAGTGNKLTISTCNTFGEKQERYVVEADFMGKTS